MYRDYLSRKNNLRKLLIAAVLVFVSFSIFLIAFSRTDYSTVILTKQQPLQDVSCHYSTDGDALPIIDERFFPSSNSIYFHETSCQGRLNSLQTCSIESAARTHPDWEIHVIFSGPITNLSLGDVNMELLRLMKNVYFWRVHIVDYAKGTALEEVVSSGALNRTLWPISQTADLLSFLSLYKWGGVFIGLETLVVKPLVGLGSNWAVREYFQYFGSTAMSFSKDSVGTFVADVALRILADDYDIDGDSLMTATLKNICSTTVVTDMTADKCLGFQVYPPEVIKKLVHGGIQFYIAPEDREPGNNTYIFHLKNKRQRASVAEDSPYAKLAKQYCPIVYETYKSLFGT